MVQRYSHRGFPPVWMNLEGQSDRGMQIFVTYRKVFVLPLQHQLPLPHQLVFSVSILSRSQRVAHTLQLWFLLVKDRGRNFWPMCREWVARHRYFQAKPQESLWTQSMKYKSLQARRGKRYMSIVRSFAPCWISHSLPWFYDMVEAIIRRGHTYPERVWKVTLCLKLSFYFL